MSLTPDATATATAHAPDRTGSARTGLGLGLDAGGTQTRWALSRPDGTLVARGEIGGFSALLLDSSAGRVALAQTLQSLAAAVIAHAAPGTLRGLQAGITGLGEPDGPAGRQLRALLAQQLGLAPAQIHCDSDIAQAWHALYRPGEGYLIYAGTGAIAAFIDTDGTLHRAGGRGPLLGDEGGGQWIAREALALVWRREDEAPGAWTDSALARHLFDELGGPDWPTTRAFMYGGDNAARRGSIGRLALAVARAAAADDPDALALLHRAGRELARLPLALVRRLGLRPVTAAGRVLQLHPAIEAGLRTVLPHGLSLTVQQPDTALAAARRAALAP
ncbi:ATPase [Roseateles chitinivorans]|uniref:ATPase n=1 Tax=Roseateles chitinivorans TaxID=2917965 RepID=A0A2G9C898_9BURK|nr:BadF/BadG/BcrA/BcrD ATPase family protein [Roseateles chitinivorans]PIM52643.1 ATPase [Roseateles chitinivorans]